MAQFRKLSPKLWKLRAGSVSKKERRIGERQE